MTKLILEEKPADVEALKDLNYPEENKKVSEVLTEKIAKIGENITIRRFAVLQNQDDPLRVAPRIVWLSVLR